MTSLRAAALCRRAGGPAAASALVLLLSGCAGSSLQSGENGFVSGDGTVTVLDPADRPAPKGQVAGQTPDGRRVSLAALRGRVVVMPVWGSWCGPCRAEAPMLADAARDLEDHGVTFLGINTRDADPSPVLSFQRRFSIPYDSIYDPAGQSLLSFAGTVPPQSIPSFVVIDRRGRIAGRILGEATSATLYGVVEDVLGRKVGGDRMASS